MTVSEEFGKIRQRWFTRPGTIRLVLHLIAIAVTCFVTGFLILAFSAGPAGLNPFTAVNGTAFSTPVVTTVPLGNATSAGIAVIFGIGDLRVYGGGDELVTVTTYNGFPPGITGRTAGTGDQVRISQKSGHPGFPTRWDLAVTGRVPVALDITSGPGDTDLQLSDLNLTALRVTKGIGDQTVNLDGYRGSDFNATIAQEIGDLTIRVPKDRNVRIDAGVGAGNIKSSGLMEIDGSYVTTGDPGIGITVTQGIGSLKLEAV